MDKLAAREKEVFGALEALVHSKCEFAVTEISINALNKMPLIS